MLHRFSRLGGLLALAGALALPALAQPVVDGNTTDAQYMTLATKPNQNSGFGPDINVQTLRYYADTVNDVLYLAAEGKLNRFSGDAIGLLIGLSETTAAGAGTAIGNVPGVGSFFGSGGGQRTFAPDFDADFALAVNPGGGSSNVFVDIAEFVGTPSGTYLGSTNQVGSTGTGTFNGGTVTYAFNNTGAAGRGFEVAIPFSVLGITGTAGSTIRGAAFVVSGSSYFSDVYVGGTVAPGNLGFSPNFNTNTRAGNSDGNNPGGPIGTAPFRSAAAPVGPPFATAFTFVQPTAGQTFRAGGKLKPVWETTPEGGAGNVTAVLRRDGVDIVTLYTGPNLVQPNFAPTRFNIPMGFAGGDDYTVYVSLNSDPSVNAESAPFTIVALPFLISNPDGSVTFYTNDTYGSDDIATFGLGGLEAPLARVFLRGPDGSTLAGMEEDTDGSVPFQIPVAAPSGFYRLIVRLTENGQKRVSRSELFEVVYQGAPLGVAPASRFGRPADAVGGEEMWLDLHAPALPDGAEVAAFAGDRLVGAARVAGGYADLRVAGVADGTALALRAFDGAGEFDLAATAVTNLDGSAVALEFADGEEITVETAKGSTAGTAAPATLLVAPNPVATAAAVRVSVPSAVAVYDVLGRLVADLGTVVGEARWDASAAPAGVYVVRATAVEGGPAQTVRVTVAR